MAVEHFSIDVSSGFLKNFCSALRTPVGQTAEVVRIAVGNKERIPKRLCCLLDRILLEKSGKTIKQLFVI